MKRGLIILGILLLILASCTTTVEVEEESEDVEEETEVEVADTDGETEDEVVEEATASVVEIDMLARLWEFEPSTIEVNQGDTVILTVTSEDVTHGISIPDYGVNEVLNPGETVTIEFLADQAGEFPFACSVSCGSGHGSMDGTLIVS